MKEKRIQELLLSAKGCIVGKVNGETFITNENKKSAFEFSKVIQKVLRRELGITKENVRLIMTDSDILIPNIKIIESINCSFLRNCFYEEAKRIILEGLEMHFARVYYFYRGYLYAGYRRTDKDDLTRAYHSENDFDEGLGRILNLSYHKIDDEGKSFIDSSVLNAAVSLADFIYRDIISKDWETYVKKGLIRVAEDERNVSLFKISGAEKVGSSIMRALTYEALKRKYFEENDIPYIMKHCYYFNYVYIYYEKKEKDRKGELLLVTSVDDSYNVNNFNHEEKEVNKPRLKKKQTLEDLLPNVLTELMGNSFGEDYDGFTLVEPDIFRMAVVISVDVARFLKKHWDYIEDDIKDKYKIEGYEIIIPKCKAIEEFKFMHQRRVMYEAIKKIVAEKMNKKVTYMLCTYCSYCYIRYEIEDPHELDYENSLNETY